MAPPLRAALVATLVLSAPSAAAQDPPPTPPPARATPPPAPTPPPPTVVTPVAAPHTPARPPRRALPRAKRPPEASPLPGTPIASAPGFSRKEDGTSRIWIEVSRKVDVLENKAAGRVVYRLRGAAVLQKTSQLPLLTGFFATPVERVQLVQEGPDCDLIVELREPADLTQRIVETPRGMVLEVDVPMPVAYEPAARDDGGEGAPERPRARRQRQRQTQTLGAAPPPEPPVDEPVAPVQGD